MQLIKDASADKLRGGFYTPKPITDFMVKWGLSGMDKPSILEPSCGDGAFLKAFKPYENQYKSITAIELDKVEAQKARSFDLKNSEVQNQEFHQYCNTSKERFDLVLGNPPYIRYQYFDKNQQKEAAEIYNQVNVKYSKLSNAWVSFVVGGSLLLKEKGRLGFVVPAELLQVSYAKPLRQFLASFYNSVIIVSFKQLVFPSIQQEVILLLCEKDGSSQHNINHIEVKDASELVSLDLSKLRKGYKNLDITANKWTYYFLTQKEINFLKTVQQKYNLKTIGDYADVEVGITTGANSFFTVEQKVVEGYELTPFARPMVGRSVQVGGAIFTKKDWSNNLLLGAKANLLVFPKNGELKKYDGALKYINYGESQDIHQGYKCRIRDVWYVVPSLWIPDGLFIRRNNRFPRLIVNDAEAYTTDTMHRVRLKENTNIQALSASFYNSLSFAFAEISGRSYGGGVLELMPKEVQNILIPYKEENQQYLKKIDVFLRKNKDATVLLKFTNQVLLKEQFGFSQSDINLIDSIWKKLSNRRLNRGKKI
ncbi:MAG: N-6 DNA methylase [Saprospiraceae bacterium]